MKPSPFAERRKALKLSEKELGKRLGVASSDIFYLENNHEFVVSYLEALGYYLSVPGKELNPALKKRSKAEVKSDLLSLLNSVSGSGSLIYLASVVRNSPFSVKETHEALFSLSQDGVLELRPESGMGSLPTRDVELCPKLGDEVFSYGRLR